MIHERSAKMVAVTSLAILAFCARPARAQENSSTSRAAGADALHWTLGVDGGIAWRGPGFTPIKQLFLPPARPIYDVYVLGDLWCSPAVGSWRPSSFFCLRTGIGWELDGLIPTRGLLEGAQGQPGVQTGMFTNELFIPAIARLRLCDAVDVLVSLRAGPSLSTLQYSSNADAKVFSETSLSSYWAAGGAIVLKLSSRSELLVTGAYRWPIWQKNVLHLRDKAATTDSSDDPVFVRVGRQGPLMSVGFAFRP